MTIYWLIIIRKNYFFRKLITPLYYDKYKGVWNICWLIESAANSPSQHWPQKPNHSVQDLLLPTHLNDTPRLASTADASVISQSFSGLIIDLFRLPSRQNQLPFSISWNNARPENWLEALSHQVPEFSFPW